MHYDLTDPYEIAKYIKEAKKSTPLKVYVDGNLEECNSTGIECYGNNGFYILFGESSEILDFLEKNKKNIKKYKIEQDRRNSAIPMLDIKNIDARIEPGAIIRDMVSIGKKRCDYDGGSP
jgi:2,3,4,5-tetrahydropyridine-2,6-dicarboxylate N-succinyltransferase